MQGSRPGTEFKADREMTLNFEKPKKVLELFTKVRRWLRRRVWNLAGADQTYDGSRK